jgi:AcrR family transcriptional regulator
MKRREATHPTRDQLLEAGLALAENGSLARMSVNTLVQAAGVAKGTFYVHFPSQDEYLVALHRHFHDSLMREISMAVKSLPRGAARLVRGTEAYLDGCLSRRGVKALLFDARALPAVADEVRARNRMFHTHFAGEFSALGWPDPEAAMRLFVAMAAETALGEMEAGRVQPALRKALWRFLGVVPKRRKPRH